MDLLQYSRRVCALLLACATCAVPGAEPTPPPPPIPRTVTGLEHAQVRANGTRVVKDKVQGSGTVAGNGTVIYQGVVSPGHSPGCISHEGNVVFEASSTLILEIGGPQACTEFDRFSVGQTLTIHNATLQLVLTNGYVPPPGQVFPILQWAMRSGTFSNVDTSLALLPPGSSWNFSGLYGTNGGGVAVTGPASIPVPLPAWALLVTAMLFATVAWRRQRIG